MELEKRHDVPPPALAVRQVEAAERAFFAGYYAQRRYHPTGWRLRLARDARVLCAAAPHGRLGRVLSVGCGDGEFELLLAARADSVLGVDVSPEAIAMARSAQARAGVDNVEFRCLSVIDLALSERFDTIVCVAFLHHLPAAALTRAGFSRVAIRFIDLTLIPALYVWLRGPALPLYVCAALDRLWCASPLAPWASGFSVVARKAALAPRP